jgi:CBS domain-containing protein
MIVTPSKSLDLKENSLKKCNEVMTKDPVCCLPNDSVAKAAELMKGEDIGSIPVIENEQSQKLVGIVTDRDLALKIVAEALDAKSTTVETVMTHKVVTCRADEDLQKALDAMAEHQLRRIPVVDNNNRIVGIIAQADVATRLDQPEKTAEMVKEISQNQLFAKDSLSGS